MCWSKTKWFEAIFLFDSICIRPLLSLHQSGDKKFALLFPNLSIFFSSLFFLLLSALCFFFFSNTQFDKKMNKIKKIEEEEREKDVKMRGTKYVCTDRVKRFVTNEPFVFNRLNSKLTHIYGDWYELGCHAVAQCLFIMLQNACIIILLELLFSNVCVIYHFFVALSFSATKTSKRTFFYFFRIYVAI